MYKSCTTTMFIFLNSSLFTTSKTLTYCFNKLSFISCLNFFTYFSIISDIFLSKLDSIIIGELHFNTPPFLYSLQVHIGLVFLFPPAHLTKISLCLLQMILFVYFEFSIIFSLFITFLFLTFLLSLYTTFALSHNSSEIIAGIFSSL